MKRYYAEIPHSASLAEHCDVSADKGTIEFTRRYERPKWQGDMGEQLREERRRLFPNEERQEKK